MIHPIPFIFLAAVAVGAALGMLLSRNAVHSALYLVLNFMTVAVFYLALNAPFIALVQIMNSNSTCFVTSATTEPPSNCLSL